MGASSPLRQRARVRFITSSTGSLSPGATTMTLAATSGTTLGVPWTISNGSVLAIDFLFGQLAERVTVASLAGNVATFAPALAHGHPAGVGVLKVS